MEWLPPTYSHIVKLGAGISIFPNKDLRETAFYHKMTYPLTIQFTKRTSVYGYFPPLKGLLKFRCNFSIIPDVKHLRVNSGSQVLTYSDYFFLPRMPFSKNNLL